MFKIGDRIDYKIWYGDESEDYTWHTGIIREIIPGSKPEMYKVREEGNIFPDIITVADMYRHEESRFKDQFSDKLVGSHVKWIKCTDENYRSEDPRVVTLVKLKMEGCKTEVYTKQSCPYGWNAICDCDGYLADIILI